VTCAWSHAFYIQEGQKVILSGDSRTALETAYDKYADMLYRLALSHLGRREDAEDAVQDVFTKYIHTSPRFSDDEHERAWLVRVTMNRCHDMKRRGRLRCHDSLDDISDVPFIADGDENNVLKIVFTLPEKYKTTIVLHYLEGFSVEEISSMLGLSGSAVKMRLSRGREMLKNLLDKEEIYV